MVDKNFWGLLETQIESLKNASGKDANTLRLETAKLLLSQVDSSEAALEAYDKFDIRELFAAYADFATETSAFYDANKGKLDPVALNGKMGQKLESAISENKRISDALTELNQNEKALLAEETELEHNKKEYADLSAKVESLREIRDTMTPAVLKAMKEEIDDLESQIKKSSKEHGKLKKELEDVTAEAQEVEKELSVIAESKVEKCNQMKSVIQKHFDILKVLFEHEQLNADEMLAKIAEYKALYDRLKETVNETSEILSLYEVQMGEDSKIVESMKKYGVKSLASALDDIDRIKKTIEDDIKAYDLILQKVVKGEEGIRAEIERRQGKNV